jgi:hypothetical protein
LSPTAAQRQDVPHVARQVAYGATPTKSEVDAVEARFSEAAVETRFSEGEDLVAGVDWEAQVTVPDSSTVAPWSVEQRYEGDDELLAALEARSGDAGARELIETIETPSPASSSVPEAVLREQSTASAETLSNEDRVGSTTLPLDKDLIASLPLPPRPLHQSPNGAHAGGIELAQSEDTKETVVQASSQNAAQGDATPPSDEEQFMQLTAASVSSLSAPRRNPHDSSDTADNDGLPSRSSAPTPHVSVEAHVPVKTAPPPLIPAELQHAAKPLFEAPIASPEASSSEAKLSQDGANFPRVGSKSSVASQEGMEAQTSGESGDTDGVAKVLPFATATEYGKAIVGSAMRNAKAEVAAEAKDEGHPPGFGEFGSTPPPSGSPSGPPSDDDTLTNSQVAVPAPPAALEPDDAMSRYQSSGPPSDELEMQITAEAHDFQLNPENRQKKKKGTGCFGCFSASAVSESSNPDAVDDAGAPIAAAAASPQPRRARTERRPPSNYHPVETAQERRRSRSGSGSRPGSRKPSPADRTKDGRFKRMEYSEVEEKFGRNF